MDNYYKTLTFELTDDHLKLLRRANVTWDGCEFGAPGIDCKRPYGNSSDIEGQIAEILEWDVFVDHEEETHLTAAQYERARTLHEELLVALQILVREFSLRTGTYQRSEVYKTDWELIPDA